MDHIDELYLKLKFQLKTFHNRINELQDETTDFIFNSNSKKKINDLADNLDYIYNLKFSDNMNIDLYLNTILPFLENIDKITKLIMDEKQNKKSGSYSYNYSKLKKKIINFNNDIKEAYCKDLDLKFSYLYNGSANLGEYFLEYSDKYLYELSLDNEHYKILYLFLEYLNNDNRKLLDTINDYQKRKAALYEIKYINNSFEAIYLTSVHLNADKFKSEAKKHLEVLKNSIKSTLALMANNEREMQSILEIRPVLIDLNQVPFKSRF